MLTSHTLFLVQQRPTNCSIHTFLKAWRIIWYSGGVHPHTHLHHSPRRRITLSFFLSPWTVAFTTSSLPLEARDPAWRWWWCWWGHASGPVRSGCLVSVPISSYHCASRSTRIRPGLRLFDDISPKRKKNKVARDLHPVNLIIARFICFAHLDLGL